MELNIEIETPINKVVPNPLKTPVPKPIKTKQISKVEKFPSLIDGQAFLIASSIESLKPLPFFNSSLILANIKILASTAMPIDKIRPAIPAKVRVTGFKAKTNKTTLIAVNKIVKGRSNIFKSLKTVKIKAIKSNPKNKEAQRGRALNIAKTDKL